MNLTFLDIAILIASHKLALREPDFDYFVSLPEKSFVKAFDSTLIGIDSFPVNPKKTSRLTYDIWANFNKANRFLKEGLFIKLYNAFPNMAKDFAAGTYGIDLGGSAKRMDIFSDADTYRKQVLAQLPDYISIDTFNEIFDLANLVVNSTLAGLFSAPAFEAIWTAIFNSKFKSLKADDQTLTVIPKHFEQNLYCLHTTIELNPLYSSTKKGFWSINFTIYNDILNNLYQKDDIMSTASMYNPQVVLQGYLNGTNKVFRSVRLNDLTNELLQKDLFTELGITLE